MPIATLEELQAYAEESFSVEYFCFSDHTSFSIKTDEATRHPTWIITGTSNGDQYINICSKIVRPGDIDRKV
jgi:hypothetical protein